MAALSDMLTYLRKRQGLTQQQLADKLNMSRSAIGMYETGKREPEIEVLEAFADFYNVDMNTLTGRPSSMVTVPAGFQPLPQMNEVPLVGAIACGSPILAEQNIEGTVSIPAGWHADFTLLCEGDSMVPTFQNGDLVAIRVQPEVENGEVAAVRIDNEATLKRVYWHEDYIELRPENTAYPSIIRRKDEMNDVHIEGKAVGLCRGV